MNFWLRILIAIVVALLVMVLSVFCMVYFFDTNKSRLAAGIGVAAGFLTFKLIKPSKKEIAKMTKESSVYHENGNIKEKGKIIDGHREGNWDFFNEDGEFVETKCYRGGEIV